MAVTRDAPGQAKAGSSFIWALVESGGLSALSLLTLLILARLVGPKELGVAALAFGVVQLLTVIVEGLLHDAVVQRPNLDKLYLDTAFWTSTVAGVLLCVVCIAGAPF